MTHPFFPMCVIRSVRIHSPVQKENCVKYIEGFLPRKACSVGTHAGAAQDNKECYSAETAWWVAIISRMHHRTDGF